jgi:hypothetical protein
VVGETINGQTSGQTAVVDEVIILTGTTGQLVLSSVSGAFTNGENLRHGVTVRAVADGASFVDEVGTAEGVITSVDTTNKKLGIRLDRSLTAGPSYGRDDMTAYDGTVSQPEQFIFNPDDSPLD